MQLNDQLYNPPPRIPSMEDLLNDYERRHLLGTQDSKWDGEKLAIYHFTTTLHAKLSSSRLQNYCSRPVKYMERPVLQVYNNPPAGQPGHLSNTLRAQLMMELKLEFEEDFKIFIKRRTANKDKDCQAEAILTSILGYSVLADLSQFNVITDSAERWRYKIERIYSHWAPNHPDERTRLEHLFRSCTDEFGFHKMYLQIKEYQQTVELIKILEMVLSENTLRQIITGAQVTNRALKTAIENAFNTIPNANFQLVTDNILLKLYAEKHFESRKRLFNVYQGLYWNPERLSNWGDYTAPASSDEGAEKGVTTAHREPSGNL